MPTAMRMVTTIVPVLVCTTNYGIPLFYSRIDKEINLEEEKIRVNQIAKQFFEAYNKKGIK